MYYDTDNIKSFIGEPTINLMTNPSFEDGLLTSWGISNGTGGTTTIDTGRLDRYAMKVTVASAGDQYQTKGNNLGFNIAGRIFTISCYIKTSGIVGAGVHLVTYWQDSVGAWIFSNNVLSADVTGDSDWTRISATATAPALAYQVWFICAPTSKNGLGSYWIDDVQIEEKGHATTFTVGTRSNTQGLLSLMNNNQVSSDISAMTFDSNGACLFNGTSSYINNNSWPTSLKIADSTTPRTWEVIAKPTASITNAGIFGHKASTGCSYYCNGGIFIWSGVWMFVWYDNAAYQFLSSGITATSGIAAHIVCSFDSDQKPRIYVNGILRATYGSETNMNYSGGMVLYDIGWNSGGAGSYFFTGTIPITKFYKDKALTSAEVLQNFNALKKRFGL
jgi:hypothetical protein